MPQKGLIPKKWLSTEKTDAKEWFELIEYYSRMEYLCSREKGQPVKYNSIWGRWKEFKTSEKYLERMREGSRAQVGPEIRKRVENKPYGVVEGAGGGEVGRERIEALKVR